MFLAIELLRKSSESIEIRTLYSNVGDLNATHKRIERFLPISSQVQNFKMFVTLHVLFNETRIFRDINTRNFHTQASQRVRP